MRGLRRSHDPEVVRITGAPETPAQELAHRQRRYMISMAIRTLCFVGAIVADGWLRWTLFAAAFVLPPIAVIMANSASPRIESASPPGPGVDRPELGPGPSRT
jgi:hypothetical protein